VETLAHDLRSAFPEMSSFSARNLWDMRRLYIAYTAPAILRQAVAEFGSTRATATRGRIDVANKRSSMRVRAAELLRHHVADVPWGHHLVILNKVETPAAQLYYLRVTAQSDTPRRAGGLMSGAASKAVTRVC
jgi:hypothetical protein